MNTEEPINDGGPAFPVVRMPVDPDTILNRSGQTLRDYFAAAALPVAWNAFDNGYFGDTGFESSNHAVATAAYQMADAMLKARESK